MSLIKYILLLCALNYVVGKAYSKPLTESMGQEVIEIAAPIKELPQDLEEEPSAENEDVKLSSTIPPATKKEFNKAPVQNDPSKKVKDIDKIDGRRQEDDEAKIEKELADIYKDSLDYKADSAEVTKTNQLQPTNASTSTTFAAPEDFTNDTAEEPALRHSGRSQFKFAPDSNDPRDISRFRTSIDEINCNNRLSATKEPGEEPKAAGSRIIGNTFFFRIVLLYKLYTLVL
ncbi:uncharacterized protein LOC112058591 [Bicyclus anynana]|uniref:Uncharacterized protein LOC112058591 n=1 Tax=Bicyclus anynana TaxID=110368 RepID=A0A6J1PBK9_BICAN|nr:uncharacterized protein LOC112058591 [Bicyclus anynana]